MSKGDNILEALTANGFTIFSECGGMGICGKCIIRLIEGKLDISSQDKVVFSDFELNEGYRLACMAYPDMDCTVMLSSGINAEFDVLTETTNKDQALSNVASDYAIAIDIGTTTLALALVSLPAGNIVKKYSAVNPQRAYGADVVSRIKISNEGRSRTLLKMIREELLYGIHMLAVRQGQKVLDSIKQIIICGNTAMIHLLMGYSCDGLGSYPFIAVNLGMINTYTDEIFGMEEKIPIMILPGISVYVGGDIAAGLLACEIHLKEKPCLFIDLGTNGEIVLGNKERILVTSTAAGPAFEGGNISCGVASIPGAICHASFDEGILSYETIENQPPVGICGTGLIELVSELLKEGIIDSSGLLADPYFDGGYPIAGMKLIQQDIRELQLAKAAIRAGVDTLLESYSITYEELDEVYIAGGFGYHLDIDKAIYIGLLPEPVTDKVIALGNTSLSGAICAIIDSEAKNKLDQIIASAEEIHLSNIDEFRDLFFKYLSF
jgi:uncharacterized 2Fe-2S/4Fe-4S cluster protein (DUF4445 family)